MSQDNRLELSTVILCVCMLVAIVCLVALLLAIKHNQDEKRASYVEVDRQVRQYELLSINPPKHFSVGLMDVETHQLLQGQGRSKHCNSWRETAKLNHIYSFETIYYREGDDPQVYIKLNGVNQLFCGH